MVNKKGQYYIVAVTVLVSVLMGLVVVSNQTKINSKNPIFDLKKELSLEKRNLLDYLSSQDFSSSEVLEVMENFSNYYINKTKPSKTSLFIFGDDSGIELKGYKAEGTNLSYNCGTETKIEDTGSFSYTCPANSPYVNITLGEAKYPFKIYGGQKLYYMINYRYDGEVFTIHG